ncbi:MAG: RnfABCDGE type electron transport complex subunit D [Patescibacteria group bacterium]|nr:RnfABCDGE type electron transport complex subunit D [Patescibacteria group bacterium]
MFSFVNNFLNRTTMYRLVLYYLEFLLAAAFTLSIFGVLPFRPLALAFSLFVLLAVSWAVNKIFAGILKVPANSESVYITALILALIITPPAVNKLVSSLSFLIWAGVWAQTGKYIFNLNRKHIFNPAAFAVALTALTINQSASWWVGTAPMLAFVLLGGLLVIKKVQRWDMAIAFVATVLAAMLTLSPSASIPASILYRALTASPLVFFAAVMLTEPLTQPHTRDGRLAFGILVGWLFAPQVHFGSLYFTPELALLAGNVFAYLISPKGRYLLKLKEKKMAATGVYDFIFQKEKPFSFRPGQYMEWTLANNRPDSRGNRRYLTLASSPTETDALLGVKFYPNPSGFKQELVKLKTGNGIIAAQLAGDFVLPDNPGQKLVFVAGGIGITPFRSMLKYLIDRQEHRPIIVLYSNRLAGEISYQNVLEEARQRLNIKTVYALTDEKNVPKDWQGVRGHFNRDVVSKEIPDFKERTFLISGSHNMVEGFKKLLLNMGVKRRKIKTDFFPGLA